MRAICLYWGPSASESLAVRSTCFSCPAARATTRASARHRVRVRGFDRLSLKSMPTVTVARRTRPQSTVCAFRDNSFRCTKRPEAQNACLTSSSSFPSCRTSWPPSPPPLPQAAASPPPPRPRSGGALLLALQDLPTALARLGLQAVSSCEHRQTDRRRIDTSNLATCLTSMRTCGMRGVRVAYVAHAPQVRVVVLW